jgi:putative transposase
MLRSKLVSAVAHCLRTVIRVSLDLACVPVLAVRSHNALVAENLFLRKQLALFQERKTKPTALTTPPAG